MELLALTNRRRKLFEKATPLSTAFRPKGVGWYVAYTHPMRENRAKMELERLKFTAYLPLKTLWIKHARRKNREHRPLFPRYLFVELDPLRDNFMAVQRADGISEILRADDAPVQVPGELVDLIQHEESVGAYDETTGRLEGIRQGDAVRIVDTGKFDDCLAVFAKADTKRRVEVLLTMLGRATKVTLDVAKIRKL